MFGLGSLTKPFTALTVVLLGQDGLLDLDAPISAYLPGYPGEGRRATVRQLLTHTSGIPNFLTLPGFRERGAHLTHTPDEIIAVFAGLPLDFEPGSRYGYSNSGYRLLDIIVEGVTGAPFAQVVAERVLRPAGMATACAPADGAIVPRRARGYEVAGDGEVTAARHLSMTIPGGAGGLAASLQDMVCFDRVLREHRLVDEETGRLLRTGVRLASGRTEGYGLGWVLSRFRGLPVAGHAGGIDGFSSFYARFPEHDTGIIVLSNRDGFACARLARGIAAEVLQGRGGPEEVPAPGPVPPNLAGVYRDDRGA